VASLPGINDDGARLWHARGIVARKNQQFPEVKERGLRPGYKPCLASQALE
jgi:hypothetical protein